MNTFGISLFKEPEQFIAVYLGMHTSTPRFISYIETLLTRTKSPPIAITYTCLFLQDKSPEELSLDIIRFISQLSDLSAGISMSSSLNHILQESSFLTELRHNLTHKGMVKGRILQISKQMILNQIQQKYWQLMIQKIKQTYFLSAAKIQSYYRHIYELDLTQDLTWIQNHFALQYYQNCSNYQYKEHILQVIIQFRNNQINQQPFQSYYTSVSQQKQIIFIVLLLQTFLECQTVPEHFQTFIVKFVKTIEISLHDNELIFRQYCKAFFLRYLKHARRLFDGLPVQVQDNVKGFWSEKQKRVGVLFNPQTLKQ